MRFAAQLTDSVTNDPVPKAQVFATGTHYSVWRTTDPSGAFCFRQLDSGTYRILVQKPGYLDSGNRVTVRHRQAVRIATAEYRHRPPGGHRRYGAG